jgi:alpha-beta hydrolase superfamily lysophospholipase
VASAVAVVARTQRLLALVALAESELAAVGAAHRRMAPIQAPVALVAPGKPSSSNTSEAIMTETPIFRAALIENGVVVNVIIADADFAPEGFLVVPSDSAEIGDLYDGDTFEKPAL